MEKVAQNLIICANKRKIDDFKIEQDLSTCQNPSKKLAWNEQNSKFSPKFIIILMIFPKKSIILIVKVRQNDSVIAVTRFFRYSVNKNLRRRPFFRYSS